MLFHTLSAIGPSSLYSYSVQEESWVSLSGSSNINTFECFSNSNISKGNLWVSVDETNNTISFTNALMSIGIRSFDCKNPILNKDLYKALGVDKNPNITLELLDAKQIFVRNINSSQFGRIMVSVAISLNNRCKTIDIPVDWQKQNPTSYRVTGSHEICMSDFGVIAPSPVFGLVKVNDVVSISFSMLVNANPANSNKRLAETN
jgi:hypothetical protein